MKWKKLQFRKIEFILLVLFLLGGCGCAPEGQKEPKANGEVGEQGQAVIEGVGPGHAVEGFDPSGRIKLSEKAGRRLELTFGKAVLREGLVRVPLEAVVEDRGENFVYIQQTEGWLKRVPVKLGQRSGSQVPILSGLSPGVPYVDKGAPLVRLAEIDLVSGEEPE